MDQVVGEPMGADWVRRQRPHRRPTVAVLRMAGISPHSAAVVLAVSPSGALLDDVLQFPVGVFALGPHVQVGWMSRD